MADSDGFISFEINDNDLDAALNPHRRFKRSKESEIYGIWADPDDSDEEGRRPGHSKHSKNYSTPVNFVSGGIKQGEKILKKDEFENKTSQDSGSDEEDNIQILKRPKPQARKGFSGPQSQAFAGIRGSGANVGDQKFAHWEGTTKGFGSKMLSKMGYKKGEGLGKTGQGIIEPIVAAKRQGRGAVGAYGAETQRPKPINEMNQFEEFEEVAEMEKPKGNWKKGEGKGRQKNRYKTVEDLIRVGEKQAVHIRPKELKPIKVVDMTGKTQKVYSGYSAISNRAIEPEDLSESAKKSFDVPELMHNLDLLLNMTEEEILRNDRQLKFLKDQNVSLQYEISESEKSHALESEQIERSRNLFSILEKFADKEKFGQLTLQDCSELFVLLKTTYADEYVLYGLNSIAVSNVLPLIKIAFEGWEPFSDKEHGKELMLEWKEILEEPGNLNRHGALNFTSMDPYHRLVWEAWMPCVRRALLNWAPREPSQLLELLEEWMELLPNWIVENIVEQLVLPKMQMEVEKWNPMTDPVPIHSWIHPWLPLMGDRLQPVYPPIRHKLSKALHQWHPKDPSAKMILLPWKNVFSQGTMESFVSQNIVPKLEHCLVCMEINPADQKLDPWKWVMAWTDFISTQLMANVLLNSFFPKWHKTLFDWLSCENPNFNEITQWYSGWKSLIPKQILEFQPVKDQLTIALDMMNRCVGGMKPLPATDSKAQQQKNLDYMVNRGAQANMSNLGSFKDLVERRAGEMGIPFVPIPNKLREAKQVYSFGPFQIFIDRTVIFVNRSSGWEPAGLENLIMQAKQM